MAKFKHVFSHNSRWTFQLSILGHPCRTSAHFDTAEEAAITADLIKFYLRTEFRLDLPSSMDSEHWSCLAYSRRNVNLSDNSCVWSALPEDVRDFITSNLAALESHRDAQPEESIVSKISRHQPSMENPAIREWVSACESATQDAADFSEINHKYFFSLIDACASRISASLLPLKRANLMLRAVSNPKLASRRAGIEAMLVHLADDISYVEDFSARMKDELSAVEAALQTLEQNRPPVI